VEKNKRIYVLELSALKNTRIKSIANLE